MEQNEVLSQDQHTGRDYNKDWEEFWKEIVTNPDGSINLEQLKKELSDFSIVMEEVPKVYTHITGGKLSYITYQANVVTDEADNYYYNTYKEDFENDRANII